MRMQRKKHIHAIQIKYTGNLHTHYLTHMKEHHSDDDEDDTER